MSAKITVSYEHPDEIAEILRLLKPVILYPKFEPAKGRYRRCYLYLKSIPKNPDNPPESLPNA